MSENLRIKHEKVVGRLEGMRKVIGEELTPEKKRRIGEAEEDVGDVRERLLKSMEGQIETLLEEATDAREALIGKDEALESMSRAIERYETDRMDAERDMEEMEKYVLKAEAVVEKGIAWRKDAEANLDLVREELARLREESEWHKHASRGVAVLIAGSITINNIRKKNLSCAWSKWKDKCITREHNEVWVKYRNTLQELEGERRLNTDLMLASATTSKASEDKIASLEEEVCGLRIEVNKRDEAVRNSKEIVKTSKIVTSEMQSYMMCREILMRLIIYDRENCNALVRNVFNAWKTTYVADRRYREGIKDVDGEKKIAVRKLQSELEGSKKKLKDLKDELRKNGWIRSNDNNESNRGGSSKDEGGSAVERKMRYSNDDDENVDEDNDFRSKNNQTAAKDGNADDFYWDISDTDDENEGE